MRGRRGSRSAAVVLAGCVGLAVMAPGLALADPVSVPQTDAECAQEVGTGSVADPASSTGCTPATSTTTTTTPTVEVDAGDDDGAETPVTPDSTTNDPTPSAPDETPFSDDELATTPERTESTESAPAPRVAAVSPGALQAGGQQIVDQLAGITLPGGVTLPDTFVPGAGSLADLLGDLPIPTEVPDGGFTNPQEACAFLSGGLPIEGTPEQLAAFGTALSQFCSSLPTDFHGIGLDQLLDFLTELLGKLPTPGAGSGHIPSNPPHYVPAHYGGYWHHQYDVDCPELTYDEANAILAWDRSDPFRLDRDNDGEACEANAHGDDVEYVVYESYPVGGVATGDGSSGSGASGVEVALAAGTVSGLGVTGLALVRRFARQG
ncbi:MAG TPA: excalibur calcium-binding domain-containing protein [Actinomycetospora sp.]|nr:excalibur calcium-binding domain-containing protein [Actinomycetospora sp.]